MNLTERANSGLHDSIDAKIQSLPIGKEDSILDVGCGTGAFLSRLALNGYKSLHGVDIALPAQPVDSVSFSALDLDTGSIPFADGSMKLIVSIEVLEHIENVGIFFKELSRILDPNGYILLTTPNVHSLEARLRFLLTGKLKQFDELSDPTHLYPVLQYPLARLLNRHSLSVEAISGFPENGTSPTSRSSLQLAARVLRAMGLKAFPAGDHLCLQIRRMNGNAANSYRSKSAVVTSHYGSQIS